LGSWDFQRLANDAGLENLRREVIRADLEYLLGRYFKNRARCLRNQTAARFLKWTHKILKLRKTVDFRILRSFHIVGTTAASIIANVPATIQFAAPIEPVNPARHATSGSSARPNRISI